MFGIRMADWTYRELEADMMIEVNDELIFCMMDVGSCGCCYPAFDGSGFKAVGASLVDTVVKGNIYDDQEGV